MLCGFNYKLIRGLQKSCSILYFFKSVILDCFNKFCHDKSRYENVSHISAFCKVNCVFRCFKCEFSTFLWLISTLGNVLDKPEERMVKKRLKLKYKKSYPNKTALRREPGNCYSFFLILPCIEIPERMRLRPPLFHSCSVNPGHLIPE